MTAPAAAPATRRRGVVFWGAIVLALVVLALVAGRPAEDGAPLDPRATGPEGARGLVLLLEELGADVGVGDRTPGDGTDVALVLDDRLADDQRDRLQRWTEQGGTLVVADPSSPLIGAEPAGAVAVALVGDDSLDRGVCDLRALGGVERVRVEGATAFVRGPGASSCFGGEDEAVIVAAAAGRGIVVSIGAPTMFANQHLDEETNAVVAAALLAPEPGTAVAVVEPSPAGSGDETLGDLVPRRVTAALLQLALAFAVFALWRARRLGRPVREPQPVQIEGSELVVAVGNLLQRSKDPERAAALLRRGLERDLAGRANVDRAALAEVLDRPVRTEAELLGLARDIDRMRQEAS